MCFPPLSAALDNGIAILMFSLSLAFKAGRSRSSWINSRGNSRGTRSSRPLSACIVHVVALSTMPTRTLSGPLSTMLAQVGRGSRGSSSHKP